MISDVEAGIITLIKSALTGKSFGLPENFDWTCAAKTAREHQISNIIYYGAVNCGIPKDLPELNRMLPVVLSGISKSERQECELNAVFAEFDRLNISYMPLKGSILRYMYPKTDMRAMGDFDILIKPEDYALIGSVMSAMEYVETRETDHELIWEKDDIVVELHKRLIPSGNKDFYDYYGDGWSRAKRANDTSKKYVLSDSDMMIYLFTHFAKHYREAGIGIKHLTDIWVFRKNASLDEAYIAGELKKLYLYDFYVNVIQTIGFWFGESDPNEKTEIITHVVFNSGVYGKECVRSLSEGVKKFSGGTFFTVKLRRILHWGFLPYGDMCVKYPLLKKAPVLLPLFWVRRWFEILLFSKNKKSVMTDFKKLTADNVNGYRESLRAVGLDYHFSE